MPRCHASCSSGWDKLIRVLDPTPLLFPVFSFERQWCLENLSAHVPHTAPFSETNRDSLDRSPAPADGDADDERVGASGTLRNKADTDARALEANLLLQVAKDSLRKEVDERVLHH